MNYTAGINYVPAEWQHQDAVLLAWPHANSDWADLLPQINADFAQLAHIISQRQALLIICQDAAHQLSIEDQLQNLSAAQQQHLRFSQIKTDDTWCRDFGPIGIHQQGELQLLDFEFNAWGQRYDWLQDNRVNRQLHSQGIINKLSHKDFILEGGSIESDGAGTLLTTSQCLLNSKRNAGNRDEIEQKLLELLPIKRVLWLDHGLLLGDDTDSHIDNLARFTSTDTIVYAECLDATDEQYEPLQSMHEQLQQFTQPDGEDYALVPLPLPAAQYSLINQRRLPASYINFLIINDAVLVPQFNDPNDGIAIKRLQRCFPKRNIIGIDSRHFIEQNGGIHCLTMQLFSGSLNNQQLS